MDRLGSEQRSIRTNLSTYLTNAGWSNLNYSEGWDEIDITNPLVNIYVFDLRGRTVLDMGDGESKFFKRVVQIDSYMESEARARQINQDIADFIDLTAIMIKDYATTSGVGYIACPNTESIITDILAPELNNPLILRWRGVVRGDLEAYYPNGGSPL